MTAGESRILRNLLTQAQAAVTSDDRVEALASIQQALRSIQAPDVDATGPDHPAAKASVYEQIQKQRLELFGAMAMVAVTRDSIDPDEDYERNRILNDTYDKLDALGYALDEIACDARADGVES